MTVTGNDTKWSVDPDPPTRRHGPSWTTTGGAPTATASPGGWFALLEKVAPHQGDGNLTSLLAPHYRTGVGLTGAGALSADLLLRNSRVADLSGMGELVGQAFELRTDITAHFTGSGLYDALSINDGLSAIIQVGYSAQFSGGGLLNGATEGGTQYPDGLSANAIGRYLFPAYFSSVGELVALSGEAAQAMAYLIGNGSLTTANPKQIYPLMTALAGNGTLSAQAYSAYVTLVNLLGTGTLNASLFAQYLAAAGFQGAGAFTALLLASYDRPSVGGGVGTIAALIAQKYTLFPNFNGTGSFDADIEGVIPTEEIGVAFEGEGYLDAEAYGLLNEMFAILDGTGSLTAALVKIEQRAAALSGAGLLSAAALALYQRAFDLASTGNLDAATSLLMTIGTTPGYTVTIDHTKVAADLTDFPVYIDLNQMPESFWDLAGDGSGIRCYIGSTELACEVFPDYNELHAKVPALSSSTDTVITIVPDGGASSIATEDVWSNDYVSVYHMSEDPSVSITDSVGGYDAVPTTAGAEASYGVMGYGLNLDGATSMEASTAGVVAGANPRTMSAWIYTEASGNLTIWGQGNTDLGQLWEMVRYNENLIFHGYGGGFDTISISAPLPDSTVAYCCLTYDGTTMKVYLDGNFMGGVDMELDTNPVFNNVGGPGYFGQWAGIVDEARLSSVERSAEWIATEYLNQIDPASFYTVTESSGSMFSGAGLLASLAWELAHQSSETAGAGTVSATITQKYPIALSLSGGGTLGGEAHDFTYPDGLSARVSIIYGASLSGSGTLTATAQVYQLRSEPALTGSGALAATTSVVQRDLRSAALAGGGSLSATVTPVYPVSAALAGGSALSASTLRVHPIAANFSGGGTLSATAALKAVVFNNAIDGGHGPSTNRTFAFTNTGNCIVVVYISTATTSPTCTYGGTSIPMVYGPVTGGNFSGFIGYIRIFALVSNSLPQGSNNVVCTQATNASAACAISFSNAGSIGTVSADTASGNVSKASSAPQRQGAAYVYGTQSGSANFGALTPNEEMRYSFVAFDVWACAAGWGIDTTGSGVTFASTHSGSKAGALVPILP